MPLKKGASLGELIYYYWEDVLNLVRIIINYFSKSIIN
jgi:hypothetical protein